MGQQRFSPLVVTLAAAVVVLLVVAVFLAARPQPTPAVETVQETVIVTQVVTEKEEVEVEVLVTPTPAPPLQGGVWVEGSSADASILNPILAADSASFDILGWFFPSLLGQDPFSGAIVPTEMAESWEVSEDGLVWTFHLQDGVIWSDGEQVTADDFKFTYDAIASDLVETPRKANLDNIESIEVLDPLTIRVTYGEVKCDALNNLSLGWLPSHLYAEDFSDVMESPLNEAPTVSAGPFVFNEWMRDDNATVLRNDTYWKGAPHMDGWIYKIVPDPGARLAQLQTDELDLIGVQPEQLTTVQLNPSLNLHTYKDDGYSYIGLNLANPENPQAGQDEEGNLIEQDPHPILGDLAVRQAIAHALDYQAIISKVYLGQGYQIASNVLPAVGWAHDPSIQPYAFDTELASQILEAAGWTDGDADGVRECNGCSTAEQGATLKIKLQTNAGNTTREDLGALVQDQLNSIGFDIQFEAIEFGTLVQEMLGQTFEMVIIGWTGLGTDPNDDSFWHSRFDTPGSGFNFVSYQNARIDELLEQGVSVPGCAPEDRAPLYQEIQQIIHDDIPYVFVTGSVGNTGYSDKFNGTDPGPWSFYHNIQTWSLAE
ncbi:MAG: ABC transporter substrate-binding protein [Caldilineaceae bacterium]|nr:ABC transporter substrate-binding protein [Caldilineaceae bacterium]